MNFNCPQTIYTDLNDDLFQPGSNYGFIVNNTKELQRIMFNATKNLYFNFKSSTIIFMKDCPDLQDIFILMWSYYLSNIIVGTGVGDNSTSYYLWNSLAKANFCGEKKSFLRMDENIVIDHYMDKSLDGCSLRAKYTWYQDRLR